MKLSLKNRFLLPVLGLIITGMSISTAVSYYKSKAALEGAIVSQVQRQVDATIYLIDSWVHDRKLDISNLSRQKVFQTALKETFVGKAARKSANEELKRYMAEYRFYDNIFVADLLGRLVASGNPSAVKNLQVSGQEYFRAAAGGKVHISRVSVNKATGKAVFAISAPVKEEGKAVGVICGLIDMKYFSHKLIAPVKVGKTGYASLFDRDGNVFAHPEKSGTIGLNMNDYEFGRKMIARGEGLQFYRQKGLNMLAAFKTFDRMGWIVSVVAVRDEILGAVEKLSYVNVSVAVCVVVLTAVVILLLVQSIIKPVNRIVKELKQAAGQVSVGTQQISASSQTLAEGASEQAASIEETSSTMEQMSAMTRQNANNSRQADEIMQDANQIVGRANGSMVELIHSMEEITRAGEQTSKIVKTIDEIAFQTNLLALNAAVEAARAGEAGAGFAVVADEVRNLAMRAADAARDTAVLIEGTVKRMQEGSQLVFSTNEAFGEVTTSAAKVGELIAEIAAASNEQAQGIEQVNSAVNQMDTVVQRNSASAEESAGAAEEISSQAEEMNNSVNELVNLVGLSTAKADAKHTVGYENLTSKRPVEREAFVKPIDLLPECNSVPAVSDKTIAVDGHRFVDF